MWIEELDIRGFRRLAAPFRFEPSLNVVVGPNESGKSTLHDALLRSLFGFGKPERRRSGGSSQKDLCRPWLAPSFGLTAVFRDVGGRTLRANWDFEEHRVSLRDATTGEDLSAEVRRPHEDVALGEYLLEMGLDDYRQVCCLTQSDIDAVRRSDSLANALQAAVESVSSEVRVDEAVERLNTFLSQRVGFQSSHLAALRGRPYRVAADEAEGLDVELGISKTAREEIATIAARLGEVDRDVGLLADEASTVAQEVLRTSLRHERDIHARAREAQIAASRRPTEAPPISDATIQRATTLLDRAGRLDAAIAEDEGRARDCAGDIQRLDQEERALNGAADALSAYAEHDASAEADVRDAQAKLRALDGERAPQLIDPPASDPVLERYRDRRAALLEAATPASTAWRPAVLAAAGALTLVAVVAGVTVHPAAFTLALVAAMLILVAGRVESPAGGTDLSDFGAVPLAELERRLDEHDRASSAAEATAQHAARHSKDRAARQQEVIDEMTDALDRVDAPPADEPRDRADGYLRACGKASELRWIMADLERRRRELMVLREPERDLRAHRQERVDAEAETMLVLQTLGAEGDTLEARNGQFSALVQADRVARQAHTAADTAEATFSGILGGRSLPDVEAAIADLERRLRENVALYGELGAVRGTIEELRAGLHDTEEALRDARLEQTSLATTIHERERDLPNPAELRERLERARARMRKLEQARDALVLARLTLQEAARQAHREFAPHLNAALERNLPRITEGRYSQVATDDNLNITVVAPETGDYIDARNLSRGTQDQIFLVQRLELARMLDRSIGSAPLLLDDPFAHFDDQRRRLGLELLGEMAAERQVIVFSEDVDLADIARDVCGDCAVIELPSPSTAPVAAPA